MQNIFLIVLGVLVVFSQLMVYRSGKKDGTSANVLYWATDPNPVRLRQVELFRQWLKKNHYPDIELRIDTANNGLQKAVVQGVAGVASDLIDVPNQYIHYLNQIGMIKDLTTEVAEFGIGENSTYPSLHSYLYQNGKLCGFPCNIGMFSLMVNVGLFEKLGMAPPPARWSLDQFEAIGLEFTRRANVGAKRQSVFFINQLHSETIARSMGVTWFNETYTASCVRENRWVECAKRLKRWSVDLRLVPSKADFESITAEAGFGGSLNQLFYTEHYGMISTGNYSLIQLRLFPRQLRLAAVEHPNGGYPNLFIASRVCVVYQNSKSSDLGKYFIGFLNSHEYGRNIVDEADGFPPNPELLRSDAYLHPVGHTNEWPYLAGLAEQIKISEGEEDNPFINNNAYRKRIIMANSKFQVLESISAEKAAEEIDAILREEIARSLSKQSDLKARYASACARQAQIDRLKKEGKKIPAALIDNIFLRHYQVANGLAE